MRASLALLVIPAFALYAHGLNIPARSPSSDPCSSVPCGQNAICGVTPGGIAYCHCQPGHEGDPFTGCKSTLTEGSLNPSTSTTFNIPPQTNNNFGSNKVHNNNNDGSRFTVEYESTTDGTANRRLPILASEASMEPQESHKRVEAGHMQSSSAIVHDSVVQSQEHRRRPSLSTIITSSEPHLPHHPSSHSGPSPVPSGSGSAVTVSDPMGQYSNCRNINNAIVCADTSNFVEESGGGGSNTPVKHHLPAIHDEYPPPPRYSESAFASKLGITMNKDTTTFREEEPNICRGRCGPNEICRVVNNVPVCGSSGVTNSNNGGKDKDSSSSSYCQKHVECPSTQVCSQHNCVDPCASSSSGSEDRLVCGGNARCIVVQHSPLCGCNEGMKGNPYVQCT